MPSAFSNTVPYFRVTFNKTTGYMTLLDLIQAGYSSYGTLANFAGLFQVKDPDGIIIYENAGYSATAPVFTSPDTNGNTPTWTVGGTNIALPLDSDDEVKLGTYTFNYVCTINSGSTFVLVTKTYDFQYVSPTVEIELSASCDDSLLTSTDATDYDVSIGGTLISPSTQTRSHTVTEPSDSGFTPAPGTTSDATRYIGGGNTNATRLWTNDWQTDISTVLAYNIATWGSYTWIVVNDTVTGHNSIDVVCEDCDCSLLQCYQNLVDRYAQAESGTRRGAYDLKETVLKATAYMVEYSTAKVCGEDTTDICNDLQALLANYDCSCGGNTSTSSVAVLQRGSATSGGGSTPSTFVFHWEATDPSGGNSGDVWFNTATYYLYKNVGGTWGTGVLLKGATGATGAAGTNGTSASILWNDVSTNATGSGTTSEHLKQFLLAAGTMGNDGDVVKVKAVYKLAANDNGKWGGLTFGGDDLIDFFTDELVDADSTRVLLESEITRVGAASQFATSKCTRGGMSFDSPRIVTTTKDLTSSQYIIADGKNTVSSAGDVACEQLEISYYGVVSGIVMLGDSFKNGFASVTGLVQYDVVFATPFDTDGYTVNAWVTDVYGTGQALNVVPGSQTETGFSVLSPVTGTINWMAALPQS